MSNTTNKGDGHLKEAYTMALYVEMSLLAALVLLDRELAAENGTVAVIWGTSLGVALLHWIAYGVAATLLAGTMTRHDVTAGLAQLAAAIVVAAVATAAVLLVPRAHEAAAARYALAATVGVTGYMMARERGSSRLRAATIAAIMLLVTGGAALLKNALAAH